VTQYFADCDLAPLEHHGKHFQVIRRDIAKDFASSERPQAGFQFPSVDLLPDEIEESIHALRHLAPSAVLGEMTTWQNGRVTGQPGGFAEPRYICAVQARPMTAHCRFAGKQEALSDRLCQSIDVVRRGPQRDVRVRAAGKPSNEQAEEEAFQITF
jgi:hypothetical protein